MENRMNQAQFKKTTLQLPPDVVEWLRQRAKHNISSMTAEVVRAVRDRMHQDRTAERSEVRS
jgi:hypothetical protein